MQLVEVKKGDFTGITDRLREMPVSDQEALQVSKNEAGSVRPIISRLHATTAMRFTTSKTDTGLLVWRVK